MASSIDYEQTRSLVADVRGVEAAVTSDDFGQLDQLGCRAVATGYVDQAGRKAPRTGFHAPLDQTFHPIHLKRRRRTFVVAHDSRSNHSVRNQVDHVGASTMGIDCGQIFGDVEHAHSTIAGHDRRDPLGQVIAVQPLHRLGDPRVRMGVQVDETGRHDHGRHVDDLGLSIDLE